jgi:lactoylglutathione lyase
MEKSLEFYCGIVGLTVVRRFTAGPGTEIAFLGNGETKIELIRNAANNEINVGKDISWGFEVDSVDRFIDFVKGKGIAVEGPFSPNPTIKFIYVKDPNGMKVQFVENIKHS